MTTNEKMVSFASCEAWGIRLERTIKRLWIAIIFLITALVTTNLAWLILTRW